MRYSHHADLARIHSLNNVRCSLASDGGAKFLGDTELFCICDLLVECVQNRRKFTDFLIGLANGLASTTLRLDRAVNHASGRLAILADLWPAKISDGLFRIDDLAATLAPRQFRLRLVKIGLGQRRPRLRGAHRGTLEILLLSEPEMPLRHAELAALDLLRAGILPVI